MKIFFLIITISYLLFLSAYARTIQIGLGEWPPYVSKDSINFGPIPQIISEAFKRSKIKVKFVFYPWARSLALTKMGKLDATGPWAKTSERANDYHVSNSIIKLEQVFFHLKGHNFKWSKLSDLSKYKIGATLNYSYGNEFKELESTKQLIVDRASNDESSFKKLIFKRIDLFPMNLIVGKAMIKKVFKREKNRKMITYNPKIIQNVDVFLLISKKDKKNLELKNKFNKGLKYLKKNNLITKIINSSI